MPKKKGGPSRTRRSTSRPLQEKVDKLIQPVKEPAKKVVKKLEPLKVFVGYFVKYKGKHKHMSLSPGIGKVVPGVWYKVDEDIFNALKQVDHWLVEKRYKDVDATKFKGGRR